MTDTGEQKYLDVIHGFRFRIALTYGMSISEILLELLYPLTIGLAINGLIASEGLISLLPFVANWLVHMSIGIIRRFYDTRLYTRIYAQVASNMIDRQRGSGAGTSAMAARVEMAQDAVDFFETELPITLHTAISLIGGIGMLCFYQWSIALTMVALLLPVIVMTSFYGQRVHKLNIRLNDRHERGVILIEKGKPKQITAHFKALAVWRIKLSDAEVKNWGVIELLALIAVVISLVQLTQIPNIQVGTVFAILSYVLQIRDAIDEVPILVQQTVRLFDVRKRLDK
jgi:ABC-type multidrug transport system fused ATPase/permease subunit